MKPITGLRELALVANIAGNPQSNSYRFGSQLASRWQPILMLTGKAGVIPTANFSFKDESHVL